MAPAVPLDWGGLMSLKLEDLAEDDRKVERWFMLLSEADLGGESDAERLRKAFEAAQAIMSIKAMERDIMKDELDKTAKLAAKKDSGSEQKLRQQVADLEEELTRIKRYGMDLQTGSSTENTRVLRQELYDLERENEVLRNDIIQKETAIESEKKITERYMQRCEETEKELREARREQLQLREDVQDYQRQLEIQRESQMKKGGDDLEYRDKLQKKNKELLELYEETQNLTDDNQKLRTELEELRKKIETATRDMEKTTEEYVRLKMVLKQTDDVVDTLKRENELFRVQVQDLTDHVKSKTDADDEIMVAVSKKVEEWKRQLEQKDREVLEYRDQMLEMRQDLIALTMDTEKADAAVLRKAVEERDKHINELESKLKLAVDDMNQQNALVEDLQSQMNRDVKNAGPNESHLRKIRELQEAIRVMEDELKSAKLRVDAADKDAHAKDQQLSETLERMRQYELGEYGLSEAVAEIKECKRQVQVRDRQVEKLTQEVNQLSIQINDLMDENGELRERLGLDPRERVDIEDFRRKRDGKAQEDRALCRVLQKEVETLEEERLALKKLVRKLAQQTGQRAVALGLTADDMIAIEEFTTTLRVQNAVAPKHDGAMPAQSALKDAEKDEWRLKASQLEKESADCWKDNEKLRQTNTELTLKNRELENENRKLEQGLKEILQSLKEGKEKGEDQGLNLKIESPTLERMLAAIEAKEVSGRYDVALHMKAQVDNLTGRNEELRRELRDTRMEAASAQAELTKSRDQISKMQEDMKLMQEFGLGKTGSMPFQPLVLPEGMALSSADVIASLNEHLIQVLHETDAKELMIRKMESALENYKRKFSVIRHQQGILYQEHLAEAKVWEEERSKMADQIKILEGSAMEDRVRLEEYDRLVDTLAQDEVEVRRRLAEVSRKITLLRVNEKALTRRYGTVSEIEDSLRKENTKLRHDIIAMETAVTERIGYLQRYKDMAAFKIAALQKTVEESVPSTELERVNKEYLELTEKYRDLLERGNSLIARNESSAMLEMENKRLQSERDLLQQELATEKEKVHCYEAALEDLQRQGIATGKTSREGDVLAMAKKMTTLEMRELNERQRADHAVRLYEQRKQTVVDLEARVAELESKFNELTKLNLDAQKVERELRDELSNCVLKTVSEAERERIASLEASENNLRLENSRLKEVAEIALNQAKSMESQKVSHEKELQSLRQQLIDFQAQSDEKKLIGKLHRHIVQLQVSEAVAVRKLEDASTRLQKLQGQLLRQQQRLDEKEETVCHARAEAASRVRHLRRALHELRRQFGGAVPLARQEKFALAMLQLQEDKERVERELHAAEEKRIAVEDRLAATELQQHSLQELLVTLKDGSRSAAVKVTEWHSKMEVLRLDDLKKSRHIQRLQEQVHYLEASIRRHETTISNLEEENVKMTKHFEERQLLWEQREMELERRVAADERQQREIASAAAEFEHAAGTLPDASLPLTMQLEHAIATIRNNVKIIMDTQMESKALRKEVEELQSKLRIAEANLTARDRVIADLRLRLPASSERDEMIAKMMTSTAYQDETYETRQALQVAQATVSSLQARVLQKEEMVEKYKELLQHARSDMDEMSVNHEKQLAALQGKLQERDGASFEQFKRSAIESVSRPTAAPTHPQLIRLSELEDTVAQQDHAMSTLSGKLLEAGKDLDRWKNKYDQLVRASNNDKAKLVEEHHQLVGKLDAEVDDLHSRVAEREAELALVRKDLEEQKAANAKAPSTTLRSAVERLKKELELKEKQHQALSQALTDLRADLVMQAEQQVKVTAAETRQEVNVQRLLDKKTAELTERIEELEAQLEKARKEGKKKREHEDSLRAEVDEAKAELARQEAIVVKLKESKRKLEEDNETLEKKVERLVAASKTKSTENDGRQGEIDELRRKVRLLEDELNVTRRHKAEKPFEEVEAKAKDEAVSRWEEAKRYQRRIETLKTQLKERDDENMKLQQSVDMLRAAVDRASKDKESVDKKITAKVVSSTAVMLGHQPSHPESVHSLQDLKDKNFAQEEEISELKRQLAVARRGGAFDEVQQQNKVLAEKLETMERLLARRTLTGQQDFGPNSQAYMELRDKEQRLQRDVIRLTEENLELRLELEQTQRDVPRLRGRVLDLQQYVEILKAENASIKSHGSAAPSPTGGLRKVGESGKSVKELERTISLLKKVVERTQAENEELKKAPGIVSNDHLEMLRRENDGLKNQLEELRQKVGSSLSERYSSAQRGTAKIMIDYERLRKDLKKEVESGEKLRIQLNSAQITNEQLSRELDDIKKKLEIDHVKKVATASIDGQGWKSAVVTRMYEEKMKKLENDVDQKARMLTDFKKLLSDAAEREQTLLTEKSELLQKMAVLERFPPGSQLTDSSVMRDYQVARLTIARLEDEKQQLLHEIQVLRRAPGRSPVDGILETDLTDSVLQKAKAYDKLNEEMISQNTELKALRLERDKLKFEVDKLKKELANFGPEFFEEIEDLKYNYKEALTRIVQLEEKLTELSEQFGVTINLPGFSK